MAQVSVVIVCMGDPAVHLYACLDSMLAQNRTPLDVWVVGYLMRAEHREALAARYPAIHLIESGEVRGFAENNNLALRQIDSDYCFVVNDDTLQSMPVVDRLLEDLKTLPENAAMVQPKIVFADGRVQTCGRTPWTPWRYAKHYLHLVNEGKMEEGRKTYTLNGACFLIKTEVFRKMDWFDERYFFTPEDIALGHKLNEAGYTVWVNPDVSIMHLAGGSVSAMEVAIKPARVRGSMIFYGEPLWLKCFVWSVELARYVKNSILRREVNKQTARNVMCAVFSKETPKEIFIRFRP